jgi:hypothetical protein
MRSSPTFSDTRFSLSFFLTTPAKKPRTECCCQSVAFVIAAIVVPFGCRNIPSTVSCLDEAVNFVAGVGFGDEGFAKAATFELAEARFFTGLFFEVAVLRADLAGVDLGLVLAI